MTGRSTGPSTASLRKLSDTDLTVANPAEDIRGRKVFDKDGEEIGDVDDLLIDDRENRVRFLRVASGGFLGLGATKFLVPVDAITGFDGADVRIDRTREHVAGAPTYDPDLSQDLDYYGGLYGYYGYGPFWAPGYVYPAYPYVGPPVAPPAPRRL